MLSIRYADSPALLSANSSLREHFRTSKRAVQRATAEGEGTAEPCAGVAGRAAPFMAKMGSITPQVMSMSQKEQPLAKARMLS